MLKNTPIPPISTNLQIQAILDYIIQTKKTILITMRILEAFFEDDQKQMCTEREKNFKNRQSQQSHVLSNCRASYRHLIFLHSA
jgi:hypothetical protein